MDQTNYMQIVNNQAVELERRLYESRVELWVVSFDEGRVSHRPDARWAVYLTAKRGGAFTGRGQTLAAALWDAADQAGLTKGLTPPTEPAR